MESKTVSALDLLDGEPKTRVLAAPVDGVGDLEIYELSVSERRKYFDDIEKCAEEKMTDDRFVSKWLKRLLFGRDSKVSKHDFDKVFDKLSRPQTEQVLNAGVKLSLGIAEKK